MRTILFLLLLFAWVLPGVAQQPITPGDYVCGNETMVLWFREDIHAATILPCQLPQTLSLIPAGQREVQRALYRAVPQRHLKVLGGLMVAMTPAEQEAVEQPYREREAQSLAMAQERRGQDLCSSLSLEELSAKVAVVRGLIQSDAAAGQLTHAFDKVVLLVEKALRCELATRRLVR